MSLIIQAVCLTRATSPLTSHHAIGSLLVAVVTGGDWVMEAGGGVAQCVAKGGCGQMHVGALGWLTQGQTRGDW